MSNVKFNYKGKTLEVQCNPEDKLSKICSKFASKINEPVESKIYIYNNQLLNLEKTLSEQLSEIKEETEEITIYVNDIAKNDNVLIKYNFNGVEEEIKVKKEDNFLEIIQKLIPMPIDILFGGRRANKSDFKKNFNELANSDDKQRNQMNLLVIERSSSMKSINDENNEIKQRKSTKKKVKDDTLINDEDDDKENDNGDNDIDSEDEINMFRKFLLKFLICLFVKFIVVDGLVFLGCYFKLNEVLYEDISNLLWAIIPSVVLLYFLYFYHDCYLNEESLSKSKGIFISIFLYTLIISLYLILLSNFVSYKYIIYTLTFILLDIFVKVLFYSFYYPGRAYDPFFFTLVFKSGGLTLIYFYLLDNKDITDLVVIGVISLIFNLYITSFRFEEKSQFINKHYGLSVLNFNLRIFGMVTIISIILLVLGLYIVCMALMYSLYFIMILIQIIFSND